MTILDAIIVGGGLSGLTAAYTLLKRLPELDCLVIEAKPTVGGRILSVPLKVSHEQFHNVDLGGQWVSANQPCIMNLINELQIDLIPQYDCGAKISELIQNRIQYYNASFPTLSFFARLELNNFVAKIEDLSSRLSYNNPLTLVDSYRLDATPLNVYINRHLRTKEARNLLEVIIKTTFGLRTNEMSVLYYLLFTSGTCTIQNQFMCSEGGCRQFWIKGGSFELCEKLLKHLEKESVISNDPVVKIIHTEEYVFVQTNSKRNFRARTIIMAIPPKSIFDIDFSPPLNITRDLTLCTPKSDHLIKFVISYDKAFWRQKGFSGEIVCYEGPVLLTYDNTYRGHPTITGFAFFDKLKISESKVKLIATKQLAKYWGNEALFPIGFAYKLWTDYEAPMYVPSLACSLSFASCRQKYKRIHWAGTENARTWNGYMEGAVEAGIRASYEIVYFIRPQAMTIQDFAFLRLKKRILPKKYCTDIIARLIGKASFYIFVTLGVYLACAHFLNKRK